MKIAVPVFDGWIAPRFDYCREILIADVEKGMLAGQALYAAPAGIPAAKVRFLCEKDVRVLICGGISDFSCRQIRFYGIRLLPWNTGNADETVTRFIRLLGRAGRRRRRGGRYDPLQGRNGC